MRNQPVLILLLVFWLLAHLPLAAQVGFSLPVLNNVRGGAFVDAPVRVTDFSRVVSVQFIIRWDPKVLRFEAVNQFMLSGIDANDSFGLSNALDSGIIRFRWINLIGPTVADNTPIFNIRFSVVSGANSSTPLIFSELRPAFPFEVLLRDNTVFSLEQSRSKLRNGSVAIGFSLSNKEAVANAAQTHIAPNPFHNYTRVTFGDMATGIPLTIGLTDLSGKKILSKTLTPLETETGIVIDNAGLEQPGIYLLQVQTARSSWVKPLIYF
jgi:Cohesin domain